MIALTIAALIQTLTLPTTPQALSQALPATASSPQIKTPDPSNVAGAAPAGTAPLVASPQNPPTRPSTPPIVPQASASSASSSTSLNTRDRTALPTATAPSAPISGGPTFGGASSIQTGGH